MSSSSQKVFLITSQLAEKFFKTYTWLGNFEEHFDSSNPNTLTISEVKQKIYI